MKKIITIIPLLLVFLPVFIFAQDSTLMHLPANWSLEECIKYAKQNNIQINSLRLNTSAAEEDVKQSKAAALPNLSGTVSQSLLNGKSANVTTGSFQPNTNFSSSYGVSSSLTLYNGGYIKNNIKYDQLALQSSNLSVQETENDITLSITQAYLNILLAGENITYLKELLATSQEQLKQGQQRFDAGSLARKDFVQLEAQVASDQYNLVNANNSYRLNVVTLKQILQLPSSYTLTINVPDTIIVDHSYPALDSAQNAAQSARPEVKNSELGIQLAQTNLELIKAAAKPTVSVGAGLATNYSGNQNYKYPSQLDNNFYQSLGVTLGIPIYSRRVNKTNIAKAQIQIKQASLSLLNTQTVLNQEVEQAYINLQNAQAQYAAATEQLKANEESYKITTAELSLGAINILDLQLQKNLYVQALQAFTQAKYTAVLYNKIYSFYTGVPVTL
ncbi:MAG TPA: TolC family protein [Ginsengibacter sp.]